MRGIGCPKCGKNRAANNNKIGQNQFIIRSNKEHNNGYDYSKSKYKDTKTKLEIICPSHGSFWQAPLSHMRGTGCPKCAGNKKSNLEEFARKSNLIHQNMYIYFGPYKNTLSKIEIKCEEHGSFWQTPSNHLSGHGCPGCASHGFDCTKPGILYYIKDIISGLYKVGITNSDVKKRYGVKFKEVKTIKTWVFKLGQEAYDLEQEYHNTFLEFRLYNKNFVGYGPTEFFSKDILKLNKENNEK